MTKPSLMIHDFRPEFLDLPLEDYVLTFDDGLRSPLLYWDELKNRGCDCIFFITPDIIINSFEGKPSSCFMTVSDIRRLMYDGAIIGGHSYGHKRIPKEMSLWDKLNLIVTDTNMMMDWFKSNLNITPIHFCFPYNEYDTVYKTILEHNYGFRFFYYHNRIDIETLIKNNL